MHKVHSVLEMSVGEDVVVFGGGYGWRQDKPHLGVKSLSSWPDDNEKWLFDDYSLVSTGFSNATFCVFADDVSGLVWAGSDKRVKAFIKREDDGNDYDDSSSSRKFHDDSYVLEHTVYVGHRPLALCRVDDVHVCSSADSPELQFWRTSQLKTHSRKASGRGTNHKRSLRSLPGPRKGGGVLALKCVHCRSLGANNSPSLYVGLRRFGCMIWGTRPCRCVGLEP